VSGLVSVVFVYKFSIKMAAPLWNCRRRFDLFFVVKKVLKHLKFLKEC